MQLRKAKKTLSGQGSAYYSLAPVTWATCDDGPKRCGSLLARASGEISDATLQRLVDAQPENDLPLATSNTSLFGRVPGLRALAY